MVQFILLFSNGTALLCDANKMTFNLLNDALKCFQIYILLSVLFDDTVNIHVAQMYTGNYYKSINSQ